MASGLCIPTKIFPDNQQGLIDKTLGETRRKVTKRMPGYAWFDVGIGWFYAKLRTSPVVIFGPPS